MDVSIKKYKKSHPGFEPWAPATIKNVLTLEHQSQIPKTLTKLFMSRSQLREQIFQTSKSDRQE
jgi:hypothetical protein